MSSKRENTVKTAIWIGWLALVSFVLVATSHGEYRQTTIPASHVTVIRAPIGGVTDAGPAIQAAINAAPAFSELVLPKGTYAIGTGGLSFASKSNITFRGHGAKFVPTGISALSIAAMGQTMIKLDTCTNVKIIGLEIDNDSIAHIPIGLIDCTECEISHNKIYSGNANAHVMSFSGTRSRYLYNTISGGANVTRGMWIGNSVDPETDTLIHGNHVSNTPHSAILAIALGGIVSSNHVSATDVNGSGIVFGSVPSPDEAYRVVITGNIVRNCGFHGIQSDSGTHYSQQVDITGNICEGNNGSGIFASRMRDAVIANNICRDNNADAVSSGHGISFGVGKRFVITGNLCYDSRSGASRTQGDGINLTAQTAALDIEDVSITGNLCYNNSLSGINVQSSGSGTGVGVSVAANYCTDNGSRGITSIGAGISELTVFGNHTMGNTSTDLRIDVIDAAIANNRYGTHLGLELTFTDADTTPSVKSRREFIAANTGATAITNFDDGVIGQEISVRATNGNTTINNTANILLTGAANQALTTNSTMNFRKISSTVWVETARSIK